MHVQFIPIYSQFINFVQFISQEQPVAINIVQDINDKNILTIDLGLSAGEYMVTVSVNDNSGNMIISNHRFRVN